MSKVLERREEIAQRKADSERAKRENVVRQKLWETRNSKFNVPVVKIMAVNVYGHKFRVNYFGEKRSDEFFMATPVLLGSEFIEMVVSIPPDTDDNAL